MIRFVAYGLIIILLANCNQKNTFIDLLPNNDINEFWKPYNSNDSLTWKYQNGILSTSGGNGDIVTKKEYDNFILEVEWMIESGGNSGIFYFVQEKDNKHMWETGPEFQIIDDENYPVEILENQKTGSCSDVIAPLKNVSNPPGNWNYTKIISKNGQIEHWLNGKLILEFNLNSQAWKDSVAISKFSKDDYAKKLKGKIGLQDHGDSVYYRVIKVKEL